VKGKEEVEKDIIKLPNTTAYLRVKVTAGGKCRFSYSLDAKAYVDVGEEFIAEVGRWKGAKVGIYCIRQTQTNDSGYADFDWFRIESIL
jgi:Fe-S cluster assembly iron-binding protein IscA